MWPHVAWDLSLISFPGTVSVDIHHTALCIPPVLQKQAVKCAGVHGVDPVMYWHPSRVSPPPPPLRALSFPGRIPAAGGPVLEPWKMDGLIYLPFKNENSSHTA